MSAMLEGVQGLTLGGLNLLEWAGLALLVAGSVFAVARLAKRARSGGGVPKPAPEPASGPPVSDAGRGSERILVVDDDPDVLKLHAKLISSLGYKVSEALGGEQAVKTVEQERPDLVVMDLLMPDQDGIETFAAIQKIRPSQRAIVISGYAGPSMVNSIQALGVHTYLVKPVERSILGRAIRDELDRAA